MALKLNTSQQSDTSDSPVEFISYLFSVRTVLHIMHLKTNSYATHKALNGAYTGILDITDSIAEKVSGYQGVHLTGFKDFPIAKYESVEPLIYLKEVKRLIQTTRYTCFPQDYSPIQNEIDNLTNLIDETSYLLSLK